MYSATHNVQLDRTPASLPVGGHHPTLGEVAGVRNRKQMLHDSFLVDLISNNTHEFAAFPLQLQLQRCWSLFPNIVRNLSPCSWRGAGHRVRAGETVNGGTSTASSGPAGM